MRIQWADLKTFDIIGSGSFGRVFHGDLLGTEVAIKECVRSTSREFDEKYFKREVDILKQSRHPNIVQFMGICKRKKRFYIVTEFLPLGNLRRWIQDETKEFGWDTRISFAIDISLALAYLHHKNIIHRDLKGENLLISENMRIKVCDFGFSRVEARDDDEMRRISYCGTDGYMAPEILLGEDFDRSVDVFSFGIVLAEMMARHVVDAQHFQRVAPDMSVSPDEILFRAQEGCPVEFGELAIHCVHPLSRNRPQLRQIVERLTAIENVDIHVGTTLVVAPSVARAARNMMRKKEADTKRYQQQQQHLYQHQNQQYELGNMDAYPGDVQHDQSYAGASSSIRGETHTWRMTDEENASSRRTTSSSVGSQSTFKGKHWRAGSSMMGSSAVPMVLEARRRALKKGHGDPQDSAMGRDHSLGEEEDENAFRMPLWDSINSPQNQQLLRQWHDSESVRISTIDGDGDTSLRSWDRERQPRRGNRSPSQLSSIQIDLDDRDNDDDGEYSFESSESGDDDQDHDALFDEDSDQETDSRFQSRSMDAYELSSDSDESLSSGSLTESVVMALDTLEIPDLLLAKLPENPSPVKAQVSVWPLGKVDVQDAAPQSHENKSNLFRKPSLISRLLPPIPTLENPWTSASTTPANPIGNGKDGVAICDTLEDTVQGLQETSQETSMPPAPPSKSSHLLRTNTIKSTRQPAPTPEAVSKENDHSDSLEAPYPAESKVVDSAPTSTATSQSSSSSLSSSSSTPDDVVSTQEKEQESSNGKPQRGLGLIRGMSDSVLESTSNALETGGTMTGNLIAAMGAKTWTSGTGGFGHWIGQYTQHHDDASGKTKLKKHTSLKEGKEQKQQRAMTRGISNLDILALEEEAEEDWQDGRRKEGEQAEPMATVKRRAPKPLTGFPHRFSLVVFSTQLLPKCDVCLKRLGVLPGWSSKHLECDDCGYKTHPKCAANVAKSCTSARKSGVWDVPV